MRLAVFVFALLLTLNSKGQSDADAYFNRGLNKLDSGQFRWAMLDFTVAIQFDSTNGDFFMARSEAKCALGDTIGALEDVEFAIDKSLSDRVYAFFIRGFLKDRTGDLEGAIEDYSMVLKNTAGSYSSIYVDRGYAKLRLNDFKGAKRDFNNALFANPDNQVAYFHRGVTRINLGDEKAGCLDLWRAKELGHENASSMIELHCLGSNSQEP